MQLIKSTSVATILVWLAICGQALGNANFEYNGKWTYTSNLFGYSSDVVDAYATSGVTGRFYPDSRVEVALTSSYVNYRDSIDLWNSSAGGTVTVVPLPADWRFSLHLQGSFSGYRYRDNHEGLSNNAAAATASIGYGISDRLHVRGGVSLNSTNYIASDSKDQKFIDLFTGINATLPWSNAFDIEIGYSHAEYRSVVGQRVSVNPAKPESYNFRFIDSDLNAFYISPRISRSIGEKTGISLTYTYREFSGADTSIILGSTFESLSPWSNVWQGRSVVLAAKTYLVPRMTLTAGLGFWSKDYLLTFDWSDEAYNWAVWKKKIPRRHDEQSRVYVNIQRPFSVGRGITVEPTLGIDYTSNKSNKLEYHQGEVLGRLYDYKATVINAGVRIRM